MRPASTLVLTTATLVALVFVTDSAFAHGGAYRGPRGEIPPRSREPHDPPPPTEGPGPRTGGGDDNGGPITGGEGGGGGPITGGKPGGPPSAGTGGGPGTGFGGGSGPITGGQGGASYADWIYWWNLNRERLLGLRARGNASADTGAVVHAFTGKRSRSSVVSATQAQMNETVLPAMRKLLAQEKLHFDIRSAATIALAKAGDQTVTPDLIRLAKNEDGKAHRVVEESAALALGLLGMPSEEVLDTLIAIAGDAGRKGSRARPFAAVSLGLLGRADSPAKARIREALVDLLAADETDSDVVPSALLALGNLDDDAAVAPLMAALETGRVRKGGAELSESARSFVVDALGRLGRPGTATDDAAVISAMRALVTDGKRNTDASTNMRRSAALALAGLAQRAGRDERVRTVAALQSAAEKRGDDSLRAFAVVSLGRLVGETDLDPKLRQRVRATLCEQLEDGQKAFIMRPFAALGLGLAARGDRAAGRAVADEEIRMPLRRAWTDAEGSAPKVRGAFAVSLGLARDPLASPGLLKSLDVGSERLRGQIALALGMIGDDAAREPVLDLLRNDSSREVRLRAAMSVGLMGEARAVPLLVDVLRTREESQYVLGSTALALGRIGDARALGPLVEIANDEKFPGLTRALAVVALGQIGDREQVPALAEFLRDMNYRALGASPALTELVTIL